MLERAVLDFLVALGPTLREKASFPLDSGERFDWYYIPKERGVGARRVLE